MHTLKLWLSVVGLVVLNPTRTDQCDEHVPAVLAPTPVIRCVTHRMCTITYICPGNSGYLSRWYQDGKDGDICQNEHRSQGYCQSANYGEDTMVYLTLMVTHSTRVYAECYGYAPKAVTVIGKFIDK